MPKYSKAKPFDIVQVVKNLQKDVKGLITANPVSQLYTYTPTWTSTGTSPSLGNGSIVGYYRRVSGLVTCTINLTIGSTTTLGSGNWELGLPFSVTSKASYAGSAYAVTSGSTFLGIAILGGGSAFAIVQTGQAAGDWSSTKPFAWGSGDTGTISATYETDD